jgi:hypothetical protein
VCLLSIAVMMAFQFFVEKSSIRKVVTGGALAGVAFAAVGGPYIAALSMQKHRFDFGDSGNLNYAWYVAGTQKLHLEPWQTERFGSSTVKLVHPVPQLLASPPIYSYKALKYGTAPDWFDPTYFNERIVPHMNPLKLVVRDARNAVLILRYVLNHPEAWVLLVLLMVCGARVGYKDWRRQGFWMPMVVLGVGMWGIYGIVNIEERYVMVAHLAVVLSIFAMLTTGRDEQETRRLGSAMVALLAFVSLGVVLLGALENRRNGSNFDEFARQRYDAAEGLAKLGLRPGDEIACMETTACVNDPYWARLAGVRILTEVFNSGTPNLLAELEGLPNRQQVYDVVKAQGAKVIVAAFDPGLMTGETPASKGWVRLGGTNYYALPLNLPEPKDEPVIPKAWSSEDLKP